MRQLIIWSWIKNVSSLQVLNIVVRIQFFVVFCLHEFIFRAMLFIFYALCYYSTCPKKCIEVETLIVMWYQIVWQFSSGLCIAFARKGCCQLWHFFWCFWYPGNRLITVSPQNVWRENWKCQLRRIYVDIFYYIHFWPSRKCQILLKVCLLCYWFLQ